MDPQHGQGQADRRDQALQPQLFEKSGERYPLRPTDSAGKIIPANKDLTVPNQNVISSDFLTTVNLNRVGGTASSTSKISVGANLPTNDTKGTTRKTDVQFFDTLGNATTMNIINTKTGVDNQWDMSIAPPPGTSAIALQDAASLVYGGQGQLEFKSRPADTANVKIDDIRALRLNLQKSS